MTRPTAREACRGQSLTELALVLPLLMTLLLAVVEFGFYFYTVANVNNAVRVGARAGASTVLADAGVRTVVSNSLGFQAPLATTSIFEFTSATISLNAPNLPPAGSDVSGHPRTNGNYFSVQVKVPYQSLTRLVDLNALGGVTHYYGTSTFPIFH